jgi:hypothetical protein
VSSVESPRTTGSAGRSTVGRRRGRRVDGRLGDLGAPLLGLPLDDVEPQQGLRLVAEQGADPGGGVALGRLAVLVRAKEVILAGPDGRR